MKVKSQEWNGIGFRGSLPKEERLSEHGQQCQNEPTRGHVRIFADVLLKLDRLPLNIPRSLDIKLRAASMFFICLDIQIQD